MSSERALMRSEDRGRDQELAPCGGGGERVRRRPDRNSIHTGRRDLVKIPSPVRDKEDLPSNATTSHMIAQLRTCPVIIMVS
jgi:hypothetical protein